MFIKLKKYVIIILIETEGVNMESRMEKYYNDNSQEFSRSKKNTNLYKEVYGSYSELEYLPVSDNVSEIDAARLKEIVGSREDYKKVNMPVAVMEDNITRKYEENKVYDINELIEKARSSKPKIETPQENSQSYNFLKTLESNELLKSQITEAKQQEEQKNESIITSQQTSSLSLDILSDLKPTGDTVVMEPINPTDKDTLNDIPIDNGIKEDDKSFYSGSYKFSKNDFFEEDDDFSDLKSKGTFGKVMLVVFILSICITAIYFLIKFLGTR